LICGAVAAIAIRNSWSPALAAEGDEITRGATDPTWSPDGAELAFSLYGAIWRAPAGGGGARQISISPGYHAHPAWSPDGKSIAFISGQNPRGGFQKIRGRLVVVELASGRERVIPTPDPTAGAPSWSPDSSKIVLGLGRGESLLHLVDAASGAIEALEGGLQRNTPTMTVARSLRRIGSWSDTAWSADGGTIFYAGERQGAPQIWSLPSDPRGFAIRKAWTRYLPEDIVNLDGVSPAPGGGVVYAADVINKAGNFELYRLDADGGEPQPILSHPRHEFTPAVSRDGKLVAFSSNRLGNMDLFTVGIDGGEPRHVRIGDLEFRQPAGRVRLHVLDELGEPTPVRLYVSAADGRTYSPPGEPLWFYPLEPGAQPDGFFVSSGDDAFEAPAGRMKITAVKGFEYRLADRAFNVPGGRETEVTIQLERWTNWNQRGWYSGENHFHANYLGSYYQRPLDSLGWMEAMDLNAANMIVANADGAYVHDKEFFTGALSSVSNKRRLLWWGQEYRNSDPLGHMGFLGIGKLVPPFYTSVPGSDSPYDFPLNTTAALDATGQGGMVTYMHPIFAGTRDVFDTNLGAKEAVVTAAHGALHTLDLLPYGEPAYELWYGLLNCGFKLAAGAGTDTFTNRRGINRIPGGSRQYVDVGGAFTWERWLERYREARSFATNGPLLSFEVNGQGMGERIEAPDGQTYRVKLAAEVQARVPLEKIEFLRNGEVIHAETIDSKLRPYRVEYETEVRESAWFAVRVSGPPSRGLTGPARAHSSPVWVSLGGKPTLVERDLETAVRWTDRFWANLVERDNFGPDPNRDQAKKMVDEARAHYVEKLRRVR
jgi:Tol biopolymer transport system component